MLPDITLKVISLEQSAPWAYSRQRKKMSVKSQPTETAGSPITADVYGPKYRDHLLEQYKLYVQMADRVSHRRALANSFFLTLHTGLLALAAGITGLSRGEPSNEWAGLAIAGFGIPFAAVWFLILHSYRELNKAKFAVVRELEDDLPKAPFGREEAKYAGRYARLTNVEAWVPIVFALWYLVVVGAAVVLLST